MDPLGVLAFVFFGVGAVALSAITDGPIVGSIICMAWGILFGVIAASRA